MSDSVTIPSLCVRAHVRLVTARINQKSQMFNCGCCRLGTMSRKCYDLTTHTYMHLRMCASDPHTHIHIHQVLQKAYAHPSPLHKYRHFTVGEFSDAYPQLPADANILDPVLMGPNMMNQRLRFGGNGGHGAAAGNLGMHH